MYTVQEILDNYARLYALQRIDTVHTNEFELARQHALKTLKVDISSLNIYSNMSILRNDDAFTEAQKVMLSKFDLRDLSHKKAALIFVKDGSGSMGTFESTIAESLFKWTEFLFGEAYGEVRTKYVSFKTDAESVSKEEFYTKGKDGGTIVSSGLKEANDHLYDYDNRYDKYVFLITDGDNLTSDCPRCVGIINDIRQKAKFGYIEINQYNRNSTIGHALKKAGIIDYSPMRSMDDVPKYLKEIITPILIPTRQILVPTNEKSCDSTF